MSGVNFYAGFALLALTFSFASAYDPSPLQDFCVAVEDSNSAVFVNGKFCKDPNLVRADDFTFTGFRAPGNTSNPLGAAVTPAFVDEFPGLNTLGISMVRIDYALNGINPPHIHPRASEILTVIQGSLYVGFVTSNPNNTVFAKILNPGDAFVFPLGMIHFQMNVGKTNAVAIAGLSSQNPGVTTVANAIFGSNPAINPDLLSRSFQLALNEVEALQSKTWPDIINFES